MWRGTEIRTANLMTSYFVVADKAFSSMPWLNITHDWSRWVVTHDGDPVFRDPLQLVIR